MTDTPHEHEKEPEDQAAPKIIVDSDWKEQVAKEKAAAAAADSSANQAQESDGAVLEAAVSDADGSGASVQNTDEPASVVGDTAKSGAPEQRTLPAPSFEILVSMLFTQAISALGQMPNPIDGKTTVDKPMAKHSIDMLEMLETKTKGNLSDDESKMLRETLHALRMAFVGVRG
ncbi:DUF1844 domain-containing protein [Allorhodopirellula heiligendammensis]|uniref:DUF1844 domain-containing protein n=1 Tax=Allorhodopirellula heiligendammensis TaxID=2714739 RepID=A0A5C6BSZ2_9BACT|nr:DUF1844 domain-containing protein [Allorhodopirellula heiligendammensis]TWU15085.1 hypothetical protein Poly21_22770 [Allorhodopirellula heiligendammensis]